MRNRQGESRGENRVRILRASAITAQAAQPGYGNRSLDVTVLSDTLVSWHLQLATLELC